jgi:hypothetical protein
VLLLPARPLRVSSRPASASAALSLASDLSPHGFALRNSSLTPCRSARSSLRRNRACHLHPGFLALLFLSLCVCCSRPGFRGRDWASDRGRAQPASRGIVFVAMATTGANHMQAKLVSRGGSFLFRSPCVYYCSCSCRTGSVVDGRWRRDLRFSFALPGSARRHGSWEIESCFAVCEGTVF